MLVQAPFESFNIDVPEFSSAPRIEVSLVGAQPHDKARNTIAIHAAIDQANVAGGGVVVIPKGEWLVAAIHLKSNVCLYLSEGATLLFSEDPADYLPAVQTTWEGMECFNYSPLIYAFECTNVAIVGRGTLKAKLGVWRDWYGRPEAHMRALKKLYDLASTDVPVEQRKMVGDDANLRPQFIQFNRCQNVLIEGVSIQDSPFWVIHPFLSMNITIRNVRVVAHGHNNDGVDIEMSQNVLIENCRFDQGDDAIVIKSGRNQDAWRLNVPTKNVVVRNCHVVNGHQLLAIGSELSAGVENILMESCSVDPTVDTVGHLVFIKTNRRRGGYVRNIYVRDITVGNLNDGVLGIDTDVLYQWRDLVPTYEERLTPIGEIHLENITAGHVRHIVRIAGEAEQPIGKITLADISTGASSGPEIIAHHVADLELQNVGATRE